jgi:hypothetical protein
MVANLLSVQVSSSKERPNNRFGVGALFRSQLGRIHVIEEETEKGQE